MGVNHRIGQEERRRKEADATLRAEMAVSNVEVLRAAKSYTDEKVAEAVRDMKVQRSESSY